MNDGGPAFPWGEHGTHLGGVTIRDYFAAKALQALAVDPAYANSDQPDWVTHTAKLAYDYADEMMKAREQS